MKTLDSGAGRDPVQVNELNEHARIKEK